MGNGVLVSKRSLQQIMDTLELAERFYEKRSCPLNAKNCSRIRREILHWLTER